MFHVKDGLFFEKILEGVRLTKTPGLEPDKYINMHGTWHDKNAAKVEMFVSEMSDCEWASVIASMSSKGETSENYVKALEFHKGA